MVTPEDQNNLLRDAPPANLGQNAMPANTVHDDESSTRRPFTITRPRSSTISTGRSPASESASTIRHEPVRQPLLGPQQISNIIQSQFVKKAGKHAGSFTAVIEQECNESLSPMEVSSLSQSDWMTSFEVVITKSLYTSEQAMPGNFTSTESPHSAPEVEELISLL